LDIVKQGELAASSRTLSRKSFREGEGSSGLADHTLLLSKDGKEFDIEDSAAAHSHGYRGGGSGVVLVFRDITQKKTGRPGGKAAEGNSCQLILEKYC